MVSSNNGSPIASPLITYEKWQELKKRLYTIPEVVRLTGMTRRQITYWSQIGLIVPKFREPTAGGGQPSSFYTLNEVITALVVCDLRRAGFSLRQVQQIGKNLKEHGIQLQDSEFYLLTDGYSVYYADNNQEIVDILKHRRQRLLLVPIHEQIAKLKEVA